MKFVVRRTAGSECEFALYREYINMLESRTGYLKETFEGYIGNIPISDRVVRNVMDRISILAD